MAKAERDPAQEKRFLLMQIGLSVVVGGFAFVILTLDGERNVWWWILLAVVLFNAGEIVWNLLKLRRLNHSQERVN